MENTQPTQPLSQEEMAKREKELQTLLKSKLATLELQRQVSRLYFLIENYEEKSYQIRVKKAQRILAHKEQEKQLQEKNKPLDEKKENENNG